jgi:hypothetical protein
VIAAIMLIAGLFALFDAVTSIFIILFLFVFSRALLYFENLFLRKSQDFDEWTIYAQRRDSFPEGGCPYFFVAVN